MFSVKKSAMLAAATAAVLTIPAVPAQAETIVVRATGPSARLYTPGKKLGDNSSVTLRSGDMLILLDGQGTRTLRGPGTFGASASARSNSDTRMSLASLLQTRRIRRARTGAVREGEPEVSGPPSSPNLWYVDISQPSVACVPDATNIQMWRPDIGGDLNVTVAPAAGGASTSMSFAKGVALASWPVDKLPVSEGSAFKLSWPGLAQPVTISFSIMSGSSEGLESMASKLITRNCEAQLNLLVETVALPDPTPVQPAG